MKFLVFFVLCCLALATAAPQFITTWPGFVGAGPRTVVAGPTVINDAWGGRVVAPGYVGAAVW